MSWPQTLYRLVDGYQRLRETYCHHLQVWTLKDRGRLFVIYFSSASSIKCWYSSALIWIKIASFSISIYDHHIIPCYTRFKSAVKITNNVLETVKSFIQILFVLLNI